MLTKIYLAIAAVVICVYGASAYKGWEFGNEKRDVVPADVRQSPGGYRSFHFWHSGFHGGK